MKKAHKLVLRREALTDLELVRIVAANNAGSAEDCRTIEAYCLTDLDSCDFTSWIMDGIRRTIGNGTAG